jgi:hypothetical protein
MTIRKQLESLVTRLNELEKRPLETFRVENGKTIANVKNLFLEKRYGGGNPYIYRVNEVGNERGGENSFSGHTHMKSAEMKAFLEGYLKAIEK